jgi:hypothetical protein
MLSIDGAFLRAMTFFGEKLRATAGGFGHALSKFVTFTDPKATVTFHRVSNPHQIRLALAGANMLVCFPLPQKDCRPCAFRTTTRGTSKAAVAAEYDSCPMEER